MLSRLLLHIRSVPSAFRVEIVIFEHHCNRIPMKYLGAVFPTDVRCVIYLFSRDKC